MLVAYLLGSWRTAHTPRPVLGCHTPNHPQNPLRPSAPTCAGQRLQKCPTPSPRKPQGLRTRARTLTTRLEARVWCGVSQGALRPPRKSEMFGGHTGLATALGSPTKRRVPRHRLATSAAMPSSPWAPCSARRWAPIAHEDGGCVLWRRASGLWTGRRYGGVVFPLLAASKGGAQGRGGAMRASYVCSLVLPDVQTEATSWARPWVWCGRTSHLREIPRATGLAIEKGGGVDRAPWRDPSPPQKRAQLAAPPKSYRD